MISCELLRCEHRVRVFKGFGRESSRIHLDWFSAVEPHWSLPPPDGSGARIVSDSDVQNLELNGHARVLVASLQQRGRQASGEDALCHLRQCRSYGNAQAAWLDTFNVHPRTRILIATLHYVVIRFVVTRYICPADSRIFCWRCRGWGHEYRVATLEAGK